MKFQSPFEQLSIQNQTELNSKIGDLTDYVIMGNDYINKSVTKVGEYVKELTKEVMSVKEVISNSIKPKELKTNNSDIIDYMLLVGDSIIDSVTNLSVKIDSLSELNFGSILIDFTDSATQLIQGFNKEENSVNSLQSILEVIGTGNDIKIIIDREQEESIKSSITSISNILNHAFIKLEGIELNKEESLNNLSSLLDIIEKGSSLADSSKKINKSGFIIKSGIDSVINLLTYTKEKLIGVDLKETEKITTNNLSSLLGIIEKSGSLIKPTLLLLLAKPIIKSSISSVINLLTYTKEKLIGIDLKETKKITSENLSSLLDVIEKAGSLVFSSLKVISFNKTIKKGISTISDIASSVNSINFSDENLEDSVKIFEFSNNLTKAMSALVLAGLAAATSSIFLPLLIFNVSVLGFVSKKLSNIQKDALIGSEVLFSLSKSLLLFTSSMVLAKSFLSTKDMLLYGGALMITISALSKIASNMGDMSGSINEGSKALMYLSGAVLVSLASLYIFSNIAKPDTVLGFLFYNTSFAVLGILMGQFSGAIEEGSKSLLNLTGAVGISVLTMFVFGKIATPELVMGFLFYNTSFAALGILMGKFGGTMEAGAKSLLYLSGAVGISVMTMFVFNKIATPELVMGFLFYNLSFAGIGLLLGKFDKSIDEGSNALLKFTGAVGLSLLSMLIFKMIATPELVLGYLGFLGGLVGIGLLLGQFDKPIDKGSNALLKFTGAVGIAIIGMALFKMVSPTFGEAVGYLAFIGGFGLVAAGIGSLSSDIERGGKALLLASASVVVLTFGLWMYKSMIFDSGDGLHVLLQVGAAIGGLTIALSELGALGPLVLAGGGALILGAASIIVLAIGMKMFKDAITPDESGWKTIGQVGAIIGGLTIALSAMGLASVVVIPGAAALLAASGALLLTSVAIKKISEVGDLEAMTEKIPALIKNITEGFIGVGLLQLYEATTKATMMLPISASLLVLSTSIKSLSEIEIPESFLAEGNKNGIYRLLTSIINPFDTLADSLNGVKLLKLMGAVASVTGMGLALRSVAFGVQSFANLKVPTGYDKDGNPTGFIQLKGSDLTNASDNIALVIESISNGFSNVANGPNGAMFKRSGGILGFGASSPVEDVIKSVRGMGDVLEGIAQGVQSFAMMSFPTGFDKNGKPTGYNTLNAADIKNAVNNIVLVVSTLGVAFGEISKLYPKKGGILGFGATTAIEDGINSFRGLSEVMSGVVMVVEAGASMKYATKWDKDGKPIQYKVITSEMLGSNGSVTNNIKNMISAVGLAFAELGENAEAPWWGQSKIEAGIQAFQGVGEILTGISSLVEVLARGKVPTEFDKNGNPSKYVKIKKEAVANTIKSILGGISEGFSFLSENSLELIEEKTEYLEPIFKNISPITDFIQNFDFEKINKDNVSLIGQSILSLSSSLVASIMQLSALPQDGAKSFKDIIFNMTTLADKASGIELVAKSMKDIADHSGKLKDNINSLELEKVTETRKMFEALTYLAGKDSRADVLESMGSSLQGTMENFLEFLEEFKKEMGETFTGISKSSDNVNNIRNVQPVQETKMVNQSIPSNKQQPASKVDTSRMESLLSEMASLLSSTLTVNVKNIDDF